MKTPSKHNLFGYVIFTFIFCVAIFIYFLQGEKELDIDLSKDAILQEAIALFDNMVVMRKWNADHGSVYVKQHGNIKPNPYLVDNVIYTDEKEVLVRINPAWMTRQIANISNKRGDYFYKITSLNLVNPNNKADEFEIEALTHFQKK